MSNKDVWLGVRLSPTEKQDLEALASKEHRGLSAMVRLLIKEATTEREAP